MLKGGVHVKSLLDIQQDIRRVEDSIKSISQSIKSINDDIEELRNIDSDNIIDYKKIEVLSKHLKFGKHPLDRLDDRYACKLYMVMLLNIVRIDFASEETVSRLVFIQWLQEQSRIDLSLQDLFKDCYQIRSDSFYEFAEVISEDLGESFLVDALIIANISGSPDREVLKYIASICGILGIEKEKLRILSLITRTVLCQDIDRINKQDMVVLQKYAKSYGHYISRDILEKGLLSQREIVVQLSDKDSLEFKWKVNQKARVEKGDIVATCRRRNGVKGFSFISEEIKAPCSGTIYQFRDNCITYGVIAHETDNKDSIKAWVRSKR